MFDNKKKVVSGLVAFSSAFVTPETTQAALNRSNLNYLVKANRKSTTVQQATNILNKVKSTKKNFEFVKKDVEKEINKARNIKNNASLKVNQAEEIAAAAKEDWNTKVIIENKKIQKLNKTPDNQYIQKQLKKAKQDVETAKENFRHKESEVTKKRLYLQQCQENLEVVKRKQINRLKVAKMACKIAQVEQQKVISYAV